MQRKILIGFGIMVAALFFVQPIAANFVGMFESQKCINDSIKNPETEKAMIGDLKQVYERSAEEEPDSLWARLTENRRRIISADPNLAVPEYDTQELLGRADGSIRSIFEHKPSEFRFGTPHSSASRPATRAGGADLELTQMEWESTASTAWSDYTDAEGSPGNQPAIGGFIVGESTKITVTVKNNNPSTPVPSAFINFSIFDYWAGIPLIKIPSRVEFSIYGQNTEVSLDFTPPAANVLYIAAYIDNEGDTDTSNNGIGWYNMQTVIWVADLEPGGFGDGSQLPNEWTGDLGPTDAWHKTDSAQNQNDPGHTQDWSWYHGDETGVISTYDDATNVFLTSPKIDMGDISDGQEELGALPENYYYIFAVPSWAAMYTGSAEIGTTFADSDVLYTYEYTDNDANDWKSQHGPSAGGYIAGNWATQGGTQPPGWYPNSYPFALMIGDGSGGIEPSNGARNWSIIQFRIEFDGDDGGDETGPGFFADDFITWGYQHWVPPYDIRLSDIENIESNGEPIFYPQMEMFFDVTLENRGEALTDVPVNVKIMDKSKSTVYTIPTKKILSFSEGAETTLKFSWTPSEKGDYYIDIVAGDLEQDYSPANNDWELKIYVREPNGRILVVDDDNSIHNYGMFYRDVEVPMLDALDALGVSYNVYQVSWNETGPKKVIMDLYEAVIWLTGLDNEYSNYGRHPGFDPNWGITLKPEDQTELSGWLDSGNRNFWLISPGVLYDLTNSDDAASPTGFLKDELCIIWCDSNESTPDPLNGVDGSLAQGLAYSTYGDSPPASFSDIGGVIASNCGVELFHQNTARTTSNAVQIRNDNNIIYFAFNYYYINNVAHRNDLAYRVLHMFGMLGGISLELDDEKNKNINIGETVSYKFKLTNRGLIGETVTLHLESPSVVPDGWTVLLNDKPVTTVKNEINLQAGGDVRYFHLNVSAPETYLDLNGEMDNAVKNTSAGTKIQLKVLAEENDYPESYFSRGSCKVTLGVDGSIKVSGSKFKDSIDISGEPDDEMLFSEYTFMLENRTNGEDNVDVIVTAESPAGITAGIYSYGSLVTDNTISLPPRTEHEISVRVTASPDQPAGDYETIFRVMDSTSTHELYSTTLTTTVLQYYDIRLVQLPENEYSLTIDPNTISGDSVTIEFEVALENRGNGQDTVVLEWDENEDTPDSLPGSWMPDPVKIFNKVDDSDEIDEITVPAFDKTTGKPGSVSLIVKVTVPREDKTGRFWLDIKASSNTPGAYIKNLVRDELRYEDNTTFQVGLVLPDVGLDKQNCELRDETGKKLVIYGDEVYPGDELEVFVVVVNSGSAPIEDLFIRLSVSRDFVPISKPGKNISLAAGEKVNLSWPYKPDAAGDYTFSVELDPDSEFLGISKTSNTWSETIPVVERKIEEKEPERNEDNTTIILLLLMVIIAVVIVVVFLVMRRKKAVEDEIDDIDIDDIKDNLLMPKQPTMVPGGAMAGGMRAAPEAPGLHALAPQTRKQLPSAGEPSLTRKCISCGENNPPENKFCQGCGSAL